MPSGGIGVQGGRGRRAGAGAGSVCRCASRDRRAGAGLDGLARKIDPGPSADTPYETDAPLLPKSLGEATAALRADDCFRLGFGGGFIDYYAHIKDAELARFTKEAPDTPDVTPWEQKEYLDLF